MKTTLTSLTCNLNSLSINRFVIAVNSQSNVLNKARQTTQHVECDDDRHVLATNTTQNDNVQTKL